MQRNARLDSDLMMALPTVKEAAMKAEAGWNKVFLYRHVYFNPKAFIKQCPVHESTHMLDHAYMWNAQCPTVEGSACNEDDWAMIEQLVEMVHTFVRYG